MGSLDGKTALVFGVANDHSISWGIAQALAREGAKLGFSYAGPNLEKRVRPLAESLGATFVEQCDVGSDAEVAQVFARAKEAFGTFDILVHGIAFASREDLAGRFVDTSREGFLLAHNISVYSLVALTRAALPLFPAGGGAVLTLTYYGAEKVVPKYNVMGVAKASLEATMRYLASDLGPQGVRVNAVSAGPIRTLAASGISGFRDYQRSFAGAAPLRRNVTIEDVGNAAAFLCSDAARAITGEVVYVDSGYNIMGMQTAEES
ncbi:MAG: enoyl-ACP reductase [Dehalococcoidia bacterium]|nr:enoyl-ACP reductase [Dehalococcoidia bacterium]